MLDIDQRREMYVVGVVCQGYRYRRAYVATQGPLAGTTEDFWRMLWEHNSTIVVMLTKLREMGRVRNPPLRPSLKHFNLRRSNFCLRRSNNFELSTLQT